MTRLSVLQLDTNFPRIPGDIGCAETFNCELEIIRVPNARVGKIVTERPDEIELQPFKDAIAKATGDLIITSCGFLAPLQSKLAKSCDAPFIASALGQLEKIKNQWSPSQVKIITFDATKLGQSHLPKGFEPYENSILGLNDHAHLRDVISNDLSSLDRVKAAADVSHVFEAGVDQNTQAVLLECTNLPPYKPDIRKIRSLKIYDILTAIEAELPGSVHPQFL